MINDRQVDINVLGRKYMKGCKNEMGKNMKYIMKYMKYISAIYLEVF